VRARPDIDTIKEKRSRARHDESQVVENTFAKAMHEREPVREYWPTMLGICHVEGVAKLGTISLGGLMMPITRREAMLGLAGNSLFGFTMPAFASCGPAPQPAPPGTQFCSINVGSLQLAPQQEPMWCWAATISNLFAYHGRAVSQATIVKTLTGGALEDIRSGVYCNMSALMSRNWTDEKTGAVFSSRVTSAYDETCASPFSPTPPAAVVSEINANRPLVIGTVVHAMLLAGVTYVPSPAGVQLLNGYVFDPEPGIGPRWVMGGMGGEFLAHRGGGQLLYIATATVT
jgi:hypothetical protein